MVNLKAFIAGGLLLVSGILFIVANADPSWVKATSGGVTLGRAGLWKSCGLNLCISNTCPKAAASQPKCIQLQVARALITVACLISIISALCLMAGGALSVPKALAYVGIGLAVVTFICGLVGFAVGISALKTGGPGKMGAAAACAIIAWILALIGAICSFVFTFVF
ncbi:unnamed protein product, partial [Didymodactylos carnosus]